jgi:hypothetical protein
MDELYTAEEWGRRQTGTGGIGSLSLAHPFWVDIWIGAMGNSSRRESAQEGERLRCLAVCTVLGVKALCWTAC